MLIASQEIGRRLADGSRATAPGDLVIRPAPRADALRSNDASVDLHLGCWFAAMRQSRVPLLPLDDDRERIAAKANLSADQINILEDQLPATLSANEANIAKTYYVPFGKPFVLHPHNFVLAVTLEWIRLPHDLAGYVIGRSGWGRRGLIIATAVGVHPNFVGCLTLELSNVGEVPIAVKPGAAICQLFLHTVQSGGAAAITGRFGFNRRPFVGKVQLDDLGKKLGDF